MAMALMVEPKLLPHEPGKKDDKLVRLAQNERDDVKRIRIATPQKPFNVNVFAGGYATQNTVKPEPMLEIVGRIHKILGLPPPIE